MMGGRKVLADPLPARPSGKQFPPSGSPEGGKGHLALRISKDVAHSLSASSPYNPLSKLHLKNQKRGHQDSELLAAETKAPGEEEILPGVRSASEVIRRQNLLVHPSRSMAGGSVGPELTKPPGCWAVGTSFPRK